jgi:hypothetical protein
MKWRVMLELVGPDGTVGVHEVGGRAAVREYAPRMIGLTLSEGKRVLAALQAHLVQAQAEDHCRRRRRCQRCGAQRSLKDARSRRLVSLFGTVKVCAPRFAPCRCAVTCRRTLNPVAEIMPDRCTPEYERVVAKMGASLSGVLVENFDGLVPRRGLGRADLAQIQNVALHHSAAREALVLDDAPVAVRLAILLSPGLPQKHDPATLAKGIRRWEWGRSSLQPFSAQGS